jgi:DNA-binding CsgD family transcriptional regulator
MRSERQLLAAARSLLRPTRDGLPAHPGAIADALRRMAEEPGDVHVAAEALELESELRRHLSDRRARRRADLERGLERLRRTEGSAELIEQTCEAAAEGCGLRRVLLSRIRDGVWSPWRLHDPGGGEVPTAAIPLEMLPLESAVARTGRAATAQDASGDPLRRLTQWESFAVAPIMPEGRVLGLLHGDRRSEQRPVDDDDRDLLWAFAEGFGRVYERAVMRERLEAQRALIREASARSEAIMAELRGEIDLVRLVGSEQPPCTGELAATARRTAFDDALTARERDILSLMARGRSNAAIAEQLAVTPSTVKSHVRNILRKLGAVNRVEAIAIAWESRR